MASGVQQTAAIVKPDAQTHVEDIVKQISDNGFKIVERREMRFTEAAAKKFYGEHAAKPFFGDLVNFMCSGPVTILMLAKADAVTNFRNLVGPTDPQQAKASAPASIRAIYGTDKMRNAVHGSNTAEDADRELQQLFSDSQNSNSQAVKEYLAKNVNPTLMKGLTELCKAKPDDPVIWLSDWLLANNPNKSQS